MSNMMQKARARRQAAAARPPLSAPGTVGGGTEYNPTRQTFANGGMVKHEAGESKKKEKAEEEAVNPRIHKGKKMMMADGGKVPGKAASLSSMQNAGHKPGYKQATEKFADGGVVDGASVAKIAKSKRTGKAPVGELDSNNAKMAKQP